MCQIARVLAKQATQKLRQRYKRAPQYRMTLSAVNPFLGIARPASDYLCLEPPERAPPAIAIARPDEQSDSDESQDDEDGEGDEGDEDSDESEDSLPVEDSKGEDGKDNVVADAELRDARREQPIPKEGKERDGKDEKDSEEDRPAAKQKQMVPAVAIEEAVFAENAFVDDFLNAGRSKKDGTGSFQPKEPLLCTAQPTFDRDMIVL